MRLMGIDPKKRITAKYAKRRIGLFRKKARLTSQLRLGKTSLNTQAFRTRMFRLNFCPFHGNMTNLELEGFLMNINRSTVLKVTVLCFVLSLFLGRVLHADGPPGPPGSAEAVMRSLNEIEPRLIIDRLPYRITNAGSYAVVAPLSGVEGSNGIEIAHRDVKLDLGGFTLNGVSNSLNGVYVLGIKGNITIRNGVLRGWGQYGIVATNSHDAAVTDTKIFACGYGGIYVGNNALIERCSVYGNGDLAPLEDPPADDGIQTGWYATISDCKARFNVGAGIHAGSHSRITACTATESSMADGIHAEDYCTVRDCVTAKNACEGITVFSMCRIVDNTCGENGTGAGGGAGIRVEGGNNLIERNSVRGSKYGIYLAGSALYNLVVHNMASFNTNNFYVENMSQNYIGDINSPSGGTMSDGNTWANFSF